jgi:hypothetical protein
VVDDIPALVARLEEVKRHIYCPHSASMEIEQARAIDAAAAALSRLTRERDEALAREQADKDAWAVYLKVVETPLERLAREIADNHAVCAVLAHRTRERDEARAELARYQAAHEKARP